MNIPGMDKLRQMGAGASNMMSNAAQGAGHAALGGMPPMPQAAKYGAAAAGGMAAGAGGMAMMGGEGGGGGGMEQLMAELEDPTVTPERKREIIAIIEQMRAQEAEDPLGAGGMDPMMDMGGAPQM